jgi:hypothetical protein
LVGGRFSGLSIEDSRNRKFGIQQAGLQASYEEDFISFSGSGIERPV